MQQYYLWLLYGLLPVKWLLFDDFWNLITGRIGLGLGDVKMLAAAACWIDPLLLPVLLFIASATALLFVGGQVVAARMARGARLCNWLLRAVRGPRLAP